MTLEQMIKDLPEEERAGALGKMGLVKGKMLQILKARPDLNIKMELVWDEDKNCQMVQIICKCGRLVKRSLEQVQDFEACTTCMSGESPKEYQERLLKLLSKEEQAETQKPPPERGKKKVVPARRASDLDDLGITQDILKSATF